MKKSLLIFAALCFSVTSSAQTVPQKAFYGGLGVNFNIINFNAADANTLGLSDVYFNGKLVSSGSAGGPYEFPASTENIFAPSAQLGYFSRFNKSKWLWGAKYTYSYVNSTSTSSEIHIPQYGSVGKTTFTGDAVVQSFEYSVFSQMTLTPYFGISTKKAFFYLGGGPSLTQTEEKINNVVGYAFIGEKEVNISGAPISFSAEDWTIGYALTAGGTYFFNPSWFLDLSYTFCRTGTQTNNFIAPFSHSQGIVATTGDLIGRTSTHQTLNSFTLTINRTF